MAVQNQDRDLEIERLFAELGDSYCRARKASPHQPI